MEEKPKSELSLAKDRLMDELKKLGIGILVVDYSGMGDKGSMSDARAFIKKNEECSFTDEPLKKEILDLCEGELDSEHCGWETGDGAAGYFEFDTDTRILLHSHTNYYSSSDTNCTEL